MHHNSQMDSYTMFNKILLTLNITCVQSSQRSKVKVYVDIFLYVQWLPLVRMSRKGTSKNI